MHHETELSEELQEMIDKQFKEQQLGPTGRFPEGKLTTTDEGEIAFAVDILKGKVIVTFGKPIASLGMNIKQARQLAKSLYEKANRIQRGGERRRRGRSKKGGEQ